MCYVFNYNLPKYCLARLWLNTLPTSKYLSYICNCNKLLIFVLWRQVVAKYNSHPMSAPKSIFIH